MMQPSAIRAIPRGNGPISIAHLVLRNSVWILLITLTLTFGVINPQFLGLTNLINILFQGSYVGFLALALTLLMISRNIDLSVGSTLSLAACLAVGLQPFGIIQAACAAILVGIALGSLNGFIIEKTGIDSFIVTLAGLIGIKGLVFLYTKEETIASDSSSFVDFGSSYVGPIPTIALIFIAVGVALNFVLRSTRHGREAYAIGGNRSAAENAGIRVSRHVTINFAVSGGLAALCGVLMASQLGAAAPTYGQNYELWAVIAAVIGGTKLTGGYGNVLGTIGGVLALAVLRNGMNMAGLPAFYVFVVVGLTLIGALLLDKFGSRQTQ
jgi:ribose transport system permease protein